MADLRTAEGWQEYIDRAAKRFAAMAEQEEQTLAVATLFMNRHPITGTPFKEDSALVVATKFGEEANCKDDYVQIVRATSVAGDAFASFYTAEAWMSVVPDCTTEEDALKRIAGAPSKDPQRREVLLLMCEHRTFESCTMTSIIETVDGKRRCGPWEKAQIFEGRFAHLVAPRAPDEPTSVLVRAYLKMLQTKGRISELIPMMSLDDVVN